MINVHSGLAVPCPGDSNLICGTYEYYHYLCDGFDDRGWGCGYRTLQSLCSWIIQNNDNKNVVPSILEIQEILVRLEDKPENFLGSKQWIGSFEACLVIDKLFDIPCKIIHVNKGDELSSVLNKIKDHFNRFGSPVMMGGDVDCSSKGIMGVHVGEHMAYLLIVDPHYVGKDQTAQYLQNKSWVKWQSLSDFLSTSFYNLCLPQIKALGVENK